MKKLFNTTIFVFISLMAFSQNLTQTVRGTVIDTDSKLPLTGVSVVILGTNPLIGVFTDEQGEFRLENVPLGRITLRLNYMGYESITMPDIEVNSGKEKVLNPMMQESIVNLDEVVISENKNKGAPVNDMSLVSTRSISLEESKRYAGGFNDPSKVLSNFAGVTHSQNGQNDIIVRGNSPKYVQWRLEGVEITNPTHFADQNSIKGGISALNNSLLSTSDFSTGAFAPEYGNVLSGVYDVKLRNGNNEKLESSLGIGILGTDLTLEGPLKKGYGGSFLVNYRYSTISLVSALGLIKADGVLKYQDAAFKIVLPTKKVGVFSLFGLGGLSGGQINDVKPAQTTTPTNQTNAADITEDFEKTTYLSNYGLNHTMPVSKKAFIKTTLAYSNNGIMEDIYKVKTTKMYDDQGKYLGDSVGGRVHDYKNRLTKSVYTASIVYNNKLNVKHTIQVGVKYNLFGFKNNLSALQGNPEAWFTAVDMNQSMGTIRNFVSWKYRLTEHVTIVSGFHNVNVLYTHESTIEPRIALSWKLNSTNSFTIGYGKHSTMESVHNYFAKVTAKDGTVSEPNKQLGLLKAHHYVLGYEKRFTGNLRANVEVYYQQLYNLPVENNDTSYYSTINEGTDFKYVSLVNKGTGQNYGIELTLERFFVKNYYFLINASLYNSTYKSLEGVERNTLYNGNYLVNVLCGKEFVNLGRKRNQTLTLNGKLFFGGGQKYIPLLRDAKGNVAVNAAQNQYWDYKKAYDNSLEDIYQVTLSASYKWNKAKTTHEIFINLDNVTNNQAKLSEYYDQNKPGAIGYLTQFGFFPNLMYKVLFLRDHN